MRDRYNTLDIRNKLIWNFRDIAQVIQHLTGGRGGQERILLLLRETGTVAQSDLTQNLGIQPGSASEVLKKLEKAGWITRTQNNADRRTADVALTPEGLARAEEAAARRGDCHTQMFACLSDEERRTLLSLLEKIYADWSVRFDF